MRGISRATSKRSDGWLIRIYRDGQTISKFFAFRKYGGKTKALALAKANLQILEQTFPRPEKPPFRTTPQRNNKTGINGVCLTFSRSRWTGEKLPCYSVHYRLDGQIYHKRFYLHCYEDVAFALQEATQFRRDMEVAMLRERKRKKVNEIQK